MLKSIEKSTMGETCLSDITTGTIFVLQASTFLDYMLFLKLKMDQSEKHEMKKQIIETTNLEDLSVIESSSFGATQKLVFLPFLKKKKKKKILMLLYKN